MLIRLAGGKVVDPPSGPTEVRDLYIRDDRIAAPPRDDERVDATYDCAGKVVMAGAIEVNARVAGSNLALARLLLPETPYPAGGAPIFGGAASAADAVGRRYAEMGYTLVVEPALMPAQALHAHLELADLPIVDRAALVAIGNDDRLLRLIGEGNRRAVADAVAEALASARGLGLATINPGGAAAFHAGLTAFGLDDAVPHYGISGRRIVAALLDAAADLGLRRPLHVGAAHAGRIGGPETIARTIEAAGGRPIHLAGLQAHAYAAHADGGMSSGAARIAELVAAAPTVSCDVGQVVFGPTATVSLDLVRQWAEAAVARPRKAVIIDGDAEGGGIVPMTYRADRPLHALQWAIGLELLLLSPDPWRVLLSTGHPNGGPFAAYPELIHLLMDADERSRLIARLPETVRTRSRLPTLEREYRLEEVAAMTRAGPARRLGLADRGHLIPGAVADVAIYDDLADRTAMFGAARLVFKDGRLAVRDGRALDGVVGHTLTLGMGAAGAPNAATTDYLLDRYGAGPAAFAVPDAAFGGRDVFRALP